MAYESTKISRRYSLLWAIIALYAAGRVSQLFRGKVPLLAITALHVLPPATFALIHGAERYRLRGIVTFTCLCLLIGNVSENVGILTGIPFGNYYFTDAMGPKILRVPALLGLAYVGMGYLSWTLGDLIVGEVQTPFSRNRLVTVPVISAFIMVAWDLFMDPVWSTLMHAWIWLEGGAYFGVPVSNFLGWYLTVYLIYQSFALYLHRRSSIGAPLPVGYWQLPVVFYAVSAAGNVLLSIPTPGPLIIYDATGAPWRVTEITHACALISLFTMGAFAVLAWMRVGHRVTPLNSSASSS